MTIIDQLAHVRQQQHELALEMQETQNEESRLLAAYAQQHRLYQDGTKCLWRQRETLTKGATAYYSDETKTTLSIAYGIVSLTGEPLASIREDNLAELIR